MGEFFSRKTHQSFLALQTFAVLTSLTLVLGCTNQGKFSNIKSKQSQLQEEDSTNRDDNGDPVYSPGIVTGNNTTPASVALSSASTSIAVGQSLTIVASVKNSAGQDLGNATLTWSKSDSFAQVSPQGLIANLQGLNIGTYTLTAASGSVTSAPLVISITAGGPTVTGIQLSPNTTQNVAVASNVTLASTISYSDGTSSNSVAVNWSSADKNIASVTAVGAQTTITGITQGSTTVTASYGGKSATLSVTVGSGNGVAVTSISLNPSTNQTIAVGSQSLVLSAKVGFSDGTSSSNILVDWSTSNASIAAPLNSNAISTNISAIAIGTALISASYAGKTASVQVTVSTQSNAASIEMAPIELGLAVAKSFTVMAAVLDSSGGQLSGYNPTYSSTDPSHVGINSNTGLVSALQVTSSDITVLGWLVSAGLNGASKVRIYPDIFNQLYSVSLNPISAKVKVGTQLQLSGTPPSSCTTASSAWIWESTNTALATVNTNGVVTALSPGQVGIARKDSSNGCAAMSTLNISDSAGNVPGAVASVQVSSTSYGPQLRSTITLTATARDANGTVVPCSAVYLWQGDNPAVGNLSQVAGHPEKQTMLIYGTGDVNITAQCGGMSGSVMVSGLNGIQP